ncbi:MAG: ClpX C4-type zinc finger protein, partial [Myxococcota bacterium]
MTCSFCHKWRRDVRHLIEGPGGVRVCDECVLLMVDLLRRGGAASFAEVTVVERTPRGQDSTFGSGEVNPGDDGRARRPFPRKGGQEREATVPCRRGA